MTPAARTRRTRLAVLVALTVAAAVMAAAPAGAGAPSDAPPTSRVIVGAAAVNMTPFTLTPELRSCGRNPSCPYHAIVSRSDPSVSNRDGLPGGLFDRIGQEMAPGVASDDWIGPTGVWGEPYEDANGNGAYDPGEAFTDDLANSSPLPRRGGQPPTMGDPASSTNKWDGVYIGGYGTRVALGAFDPIWARAMYLRDFRTGATVAWVSVDLTGYFSDVVPEIRRRLPDGLAVDEIVLAHTHNHEGPDTVGLWGPDTLVDGTYPRYERYIEAKIAEAIALAARRARPARFRFGAIRPGETFVTPRGNVESLEGMQSRNSCRTPWYFDDELRVMQVVIDGGRHDGRTMATAINWGTHVESMDAGNRYLSSDFPHTARALLEQQLDGVSLWLPGAQGAVEIVGDSCTRRWRRDTFDGETFPVDPETGEPLAFRPYDNDEARRRTYAIGRVIGAAALAAIEDAPLEPADAPFDVRRARFCFPGNNEGLVALVVAGVIDKAFADPACPPAGGTPQIRTDLWAMRLGSASFLTVPGELAPELYYGDAQVNRASGIGDYIEANPEALSCAGRSHHHPTNPGAHTDRPYEPDIRAAQSARYGGGVRFVVGYTPDLFGYIVPGYDFYWLGAPGGFGIPVEQAADPCREHPPDLAVPGARYNTHYQETNSAGSMLGPAVACELVRLIGDPLGHAAASEACAEWDLTKLTGRPPDGPILETNCPADPEACTYRHY